jgi:hypothetical protein
MCLSPKIKPLQFPRASQWEILLLGVLSLKISLPFAVDGDFNQIKIDVVTTELCIVGYSICLREQSYSLITFDYPLISMFLPRVEILIIKRKINRCRPPLSLILRLGMLSIPRSGPVDDALLVQSELAKGAERFSVRSVRLADTRRVGHSQRRLTHACFSPHRCKELSLEQEGALNLPTFSDKLGLA